MNHETKVLKAKDHLDMRGTQTLATAATTPTTLHGTVIPESPRWLQSQGKHQMVKTVLEKIAEKNNKAITQALPTNTVNEEESNTVRNELNTTTRVTLLDVVKSPLLCVRMFFMFFIWTVTTLVYYGLSLNVTTFGSGEEDFGPFVDFIFAALIEIFRLHPSLGWHESVGPQEFIDPLHGLGRSHMFPTSIRSTVLGLCSTFARIGGMLAPFSRYLEVVYGPLPLLVFGVLAVVAAALNLVMPETLKTELPDTVEDALRLGRSVVPIQDTVPVLRDVGQHE
ncbi:Solute carrier family 22 member 1 [Chionoecetes opilio]|uniref:Solute carrier family 22 member 1 n=1 Tax=Chionoecetes opilio TaxID=41210 RepID=A0A8J4YMN1_CHIOP|nr:Solute carrier family 22 member 1 [Chionoecetes opilio]